MSTLEKFELALIPVIGLVVGLLVPALPRAINAGYLLLTMSAILLLQSLLRDLFLLASVKKSSQPQMNKVRCMCLESTVGITGIVVGAGLFGLGVDAAIMLQNWSGSVLVLIILGTGFGIKDFILETNPWRVRQDKNHMNIIVTWNR